MMMILAGIGGIFGAAARYLLGKWITNLKETVFPFGTWTINLTGSFALGFTFILYRNGVIPDWLWFFWGIGFLGAYTTFSTFGYETVILMEKGKWNTALFYVISSVILGVVFAWIGTFLVGMMV